MSQEYENFWTTQQAEIDEEMGNMMANAEELKIQGLKAVRVIKKDLLEKVRKNRNEHVEQFKEAESGYRLKVIAALEKALADAKEGKGYNATAGLELSVPHDHTIDYDRVIAVLEWTQDEEIVLPLDEFSKYVLNEWAWMRGFKENYAVYSGPIGR